MDADVVVVGAGLSGLCAARRLVGAGLRVEIIEADRRVGGRTLTEDVDGHRIDLGGQWIGPAQDRVLALAEELGIDTYPQFCTGDKLFRWSGTLQRYRGYLPKIPLLHLAELGWRIAGLNRASRSVSFESPMDGPRSREWDRMTVADWLGRVKTRGARDVLRLAIEQVCASRLEELSFLYFLCYLQSGGGVESLTEISGGAQERRLVLGGQSLALRLTEGLGDRISLGEPLLKARVDGAVAVLTTDRRELRCRRVVLAIPPAQISRIEFDPLMPSARRAVDHGMPMGKVIKCVAIYSRPFWRERGLSGEAVSPGGLLGAVFDACSADGGTAALLGFMVGGEAARWSQRRRVERRAAVVRELTEIFGEEAAEPIAYADKDWLREPWVGGCFVGVAGPGVLSASGRALRRPVPPFHFAGTETATRWMGYLDGAIEAGERAGREVTEALL